MRAVAAAHKIPQVSAPAITAPAIAKRCAASAPESSGRPIAASQNATFQGLVSAIAAPSA